MLCESFAIIYIFFCNILRSINDVRLGVNYRVEYFTTRVSMKMSQGRSFGFFNGLVPRVNLSRPPPHATLSARLIRVKSLPVQRYLWFPFYGIAYIYIVVRYARFRSPFTDFFPPCGIIVSRIELRDFYSDRDNSDDNERVCEYAYWNYFPRIYNRIARHYRIRGQICFCKCVT